MRYQILSWRFGGSDPGAGGDSHSCGAGSNKPNAWGTKPQGMIHSGAISSIEILRCSAESAGCDAHRELPLFSGWWHGASAVAQAPILQRTKHCAFAITSAMVTRIRTLVARCINPGRYLF